MERDSIYIIGVMVVMVVEQRQSMTMKKQSTERERERESNHQEIIRKELVRVTVLGYLAKTPDFRIEGQIEVEVYSVSDHGGDKHVTTRSHTGNLICLNGVPVHWRSAKQLLEIERYLRWICFD